MAETAPNIYIIGAQSTGKSTLAGSLMEHFASISTPQAHGGTTLTKPRLISEVARETMQKHQLKTSEIFSSAAGVVELQRLILEAQLAAESLPGWYISDRSGLDPLIYAHMYGGGTAVAGQLEASETSQRLLQNMRRSLVLICEPNRLWLVDDGVRHMPETEEAWNEMHRHFCAELERLEISYQVLPANEPDIDLRVSMVCRWYNETRQLHST